MSKRDPWGQRILRVVDHVQAHLDEDVAPETLADIAGLSLHHFHRVFRGLTGESVMGFVRRLRLERAAMQLKLGEAPVTQVALEAGYGSHEAFTRAFRSRFGVPPRAYREQTRVEVEVGVPRVELRDDPALTCIGLRHTGSYSECGQTWGELMAHAAKAGWMPHVLGSVGLAYDDPDITAAERLRYDACMVMDPARARALCRPPFVLRELPAGRYAITLHRGDFESILETYVGLIGRALPFRGVELANEPVIERYLDDPATVPLHEMRTEICVRIETRPS